MRDTYAASALQEAANRVQSMSRLYEKLYRSSNFSEIPVEGYLSPLVDEIIANFPNSVSVKLIKEIDDTILEVRKLQPLGIIINELLTNIMKYAFNEKHGGIISLSLKKTGNRVTLTVSDDGAGMPDSIDFNKSTGFGMQLVYLLARQMGASIKVETAEGTKFILEFSV
jgi:two-component sensor histidine kinase